MAAQGLRREAGIGLIAVFAIALVLIACRQVPDTTLKGPTQPTDQERFERLVMEARDLYDRNPRTVGEVEQAAGKLADALKMRTDDDNTLMLATRVAAWLGGFHNDDKVRERHTRDGLTYANTVLERNPADLSATYYRAVLAGYLGDLNRNYGLDAVRTIEDAMKKLIEAEYDIDHAGPHRVYGVLLMRAPGPPTSIGSMRNAGRELQRAVELHPDWPENQLYLAEWEFQHAKDRNRPAFADQARDRLNEYLLKPDARAPRGYGFEFERWQALAKELLERNR